MPVEVSLDMARLVSEHRTLRDAVLALHAVRPETWGAEIFRLGLWIALPLIAMLLFVNMMLGIIARVAPQISIFSVGFPVTLSMGLLGVMFTLPLLEGPFTAALEQMLSFFR